MDLHLATSSSITSRQTTAGEDSPSPSPSVRSPTRKRICHVRRWGNNEEGGGKIACFDKNSFTVVLNGPVPAVLPSSGKVRKSLRSAVTLLFNLFIGLPFTTIPPSNWTRRESPRSRRVRSEISILVTDLNGILLDRTFTILSMNKIPQRRREIQRRWGKEELCCWERKRKRRRRGGKKSWRTFVSEWEIRVW